MNGDGKGPLEPEIKARVFISYSRKDMPFADRLEAALKARGFEPLIDRSEIFAFEDWWKRIEVLIARSDTVIFVLSPDAIGSDVALKEVARAASLNKRFAPIVYRRVDAQALPEALRRLNFIYFDDAASFEASADRLADGLRTDIEWIRQHTEFGEAAHQWSAAGKPNGLLLRSPALERAEHWVASRPAAAPEPTDEIKSFISASRLAAQLTWRRQRQIRATLAVLSCGALAGLIGWIKHDQLATLLHEATVTYPYYWRYVRPKILSAESETRLKAGDAFQECLQEAQCPQMIVIPHGSFMMGSPASEPGHQINEEPRHPVTFARPFAVSTYQITFEQWDSCVAYGDCEPITDDHGWGRGRQPVVGVSWDQAAQYASWLAKITGKPYRLLSDAEYEYAARAGTQTIYFWGDDVGTGNANCLGCGSQWDGKQPAPVGSFAPNAFRLHDMAGNVWQWLEDCFHGNYVGAPADGSAWIDSGHCNGRMVRGGSYGNLPPNLRSAYHLAYGPDTKISFQGFRVGRSLSP